MRRAIAAGVLLLLATNAAVLGGAWYNRSGSPLTDIVLTERELPVQQMTGGDGENSGMALSLEWHLLDADMDTIRTYTRYGTPVWLDEAKLVELGFAVDRMRNDSERYRYRTNHLSVDVTVVLEYDGEAWREALQSAEERLEELRFEAASDPDDENLEKRLRHLEQQLERLKVSQSRLYAVDAGLERESLLQKYSDAGRYLFARGRIGLRWGEDDVEGQIRQLFIDRIHVPLPHSRMLSGLVEAAEAASRSDEIAPPRYRVRLKIGTRLEPWIESVEITQAGRQ